jgi:hypothetical protein
MDDLRTKRRRRELSDAVACARAERSPRGSAPASDGRPVRETNPPAVAAAWRSGGWRSGRRRASSGKSRTIEVISV